MITWKDIKLKDYLEIQKIVNDEYLDEYIKTLYICRILFPSVVFSLDMPYAELCKYSSKLDLSNIDTKRCRLKKEYEVGKMVVSVATNIKKVTTAQFLDYSNFIKQGKEVEAICVFLIPVGFDYNKLYDFDNLVKLVKENLSAEDYLTINFMLQRKYNKYLLTFANSLLWKMLPKMMWMYIKMWIKSKFKRKQK